VDSTWLSFMPVTVDRDSKARQHIAGRMPASPAAFAGTTRLPTNFAHNNYNNNSSEHVYLVGEGRLQFQTTSKTLIVLAVGVFHSVACLREATAAAV